MEAPAKIVEERGSGRLTRETYIPRHLRQRRINQPLKIHLLILNIKQRLSRSQTRFPKSKWPSTLIPIQRLDIQHLKRLADILGSEDCALALLHETHGFDDYLSHAVLDFLGERPDGFFAESGDADGFGDIADVVRVPDELWVGHVG